MHKLCTPPPPLPLCCPLMNYVVSIPIHNNACVRHGGQRQWAGLLTLTLARVLRMSAGRRNDSVSLDMWTYADVC